MIFQTCSCWDNPSRKKKLSVKDETHEDIDDEVDWDDLYELDIMSLDEGRWCKRMFERKSKIYIWYIYTEWYEFYTW